MNKLHTLILAITIAFSANSQTSLSFSACTSGTVTLNIVDLCIDQSNIIYASTNNTARFLKSNDNGITWTNCLISGPAPTGAIVNLSNKLISENKQSIDGGSTWTTYTGLGTGVYKFIKQSETSAIACFIGSYQKTLDGGTTWSNAVFYPTVASLHVIQSSIFSLSNGDIIIGYGNVIPTKYLVSKDNLATYSYSLSIGSSIGAYKSGYLDANGNYILLKSNGNIDGYSQNQNLTAPTFTNGYTLSGSTNTVSAFGAGILTSTGSFLVFDANATTNAVLRTATTSTTTNGVNELTSTKITLYPNPCINILNIANLTNDVTYTITNQLGQTLLQGTTNEQINTSSLPTGIYFASFNHSNVIKFIKE
jgi:hypothetical protein